MITITSVPIDLEPLQQLGMHGLTVLTKELRSLLNQVQNVQDCIFDANRDGRDGKTLVACIEIDGAKYLLKMLLDALCEAIEAEDIQMSLRLDNTGNN